MFGAAEGENFGGWLFPKGVEELDWCWERMQRSHSEQELSMDVAGCRRDGRKECLVSFLGRISLAALVHFGAVSVIQPQVRIVREERSFPLRLKPRQQSPEKSWTKVTSITKSRLLARLITDADLQVSLFRSCD